MGSHDGRKWLINLITLVSFRPLRIGLWDPFQYGLFIAYEFWAILSTEPSTWDPILQEGGEKQHDWINQTVSWGWLPQMVVKRIRESPEKIKQHSGVGIADR